MKEQKSYSIVNLTFVGTKLLTMEEKMNEKMFMAILAKITANQYATMELLTLIGVGSDDSKKETRDQLMAQALSRSEDYYTALLPEFLKSTNGK